MEGSGAREGRGPMKSVNSRARKVASPPVGKRAVGNMRTRSANLVRSLPVRQSAGSQVCRSAFYPYHISICIFSVCLYFYIFCIRIQLFTAVCVVIHCTRILFHCYTILLFSVNFTGTILLNRYPPSSCVPYF